ncbi:uncharacterized mitochondrial protein AtMg00810-like [Lycium ferocissimum]|uniref:uncharacterized mitochondrial protein AtMg00810-like n=1 Tax=Lycium ferocissimum TaxID=112874 RepID=UPI0028165200|nr:uncharacterized mitochondrial protein AtMg00810-like [Lycium ferocissimum]
MRSKNGILLNQMKYTLELISDVGLSGAKSASTPLEENVKLTFLDYDATVAKDSDNKTDKTNDPVLEDIECYQKLVALRVVRYAKRAPGLGILLKRNPIKDLTVFCDSDWASCPNTRRSVTSFVIQLGGSLISWKSKKQHTVS